MRQFKFDGKNQIFDDKGKSLLIVIPNECSELFLKKACKLMVEALNGKGKPNE